jgi:hypothetical protein
MTQATNDTELRDRYVAVWNEHEPDRRRALVESLWAPDARHVLQPPQEMREQAAALGFPFAALEAHGHIALRERVRIAHEEFVSPGTFAFRAQGEVVRVGDALRFEWEMLDQATQTPVGSGTQFVVLAADGRIQLDYQFIDG